MVGSRGELAKVFDCKNPCETIPYRVRSPAEQDIVTTFQAIAKAAFAHDSEAYAKHLADEISLPVLARQVGMSERSFSRRYVEATGLTPVHAVERLRVEAARRLLSESRLPVKRISQRCGFGSEETMRRSFLRLLATTPQDYRSRFSA